MEDDQNAETVDARAEESNEFSESMHELSRDRDGQNAEKNDCSKQKRVCGKNKNCPSCSSHTKMERNKPVDDSVQRNARKTQVEQAALTK